MKTIPHLTPIIAPYAISALERFRRARDGAAIVEFALIIPVLMLLLFGGVEITRTVLIHQKLNKTVMTMADLVTQSEEPTVADINRLFDATRHLMQPFDFNTDGIVIISSVGRRDGNAAMVNWQRTGGGSYSATSQVGCSGCLANLPAGFAMRDGEDAIVAEVYFDHTILLEMGIINGAEIYKQAIYRPRLGAMDVLNP